MYSHILDKFPCQWSSLTENMHVSECVSSWPLSLVQRLWWQSNKLDFIIKVFVCQFFSEFICQYSSLEQKHSFCDFLVLMLSWLIINSILCYNSGWTLVWWQVPSTQVMCQGFKSRITNQPLQNLGLRLPTTTPLRPHRTGILVHFEQPLKKKNYYNKCVNLLCVWMNMEGFSPAVSVIFM